MCTYSRTVKDDFCMAKSRSPVTWSEIFRPAQHSATYINVCCFFSKKKPRFQRNTAMGCCFAPVQQAIRQHVQSADDRLLYQCVPTRTRTKLTACLFKTHVRPTTYAGKTPPPLLHFNHFSNTRHHVLYFDVFLMDLQLGGQ